MLGFFALTLFLSAALLFMVQPMIGKMLLPSLGGTPAVWNTCMVFFQAVLLLGYGYTHFVTKLPRRGQLLLQGLILLAPLVFLPFSLGNWQPPAVDNPVLSVLALLAILVGVPFFVVSTTAPLLQKWFAFTGHPAAKDPYFLYGASNLGSMLGLLLYPVLVEPNFAVDEQASVWRFGYLAFASLVFACIAVCFAAKPMPEERPAVAPEVERTSVAVGKLRLSSSPLEPAAQIAMSDVLTVKRRLRWVALAAIPSSLMLGMTTYLTTDIAAIPFFWVIPLALYLMTFILVFARWPVVWTQEPHELVLYAQPCFLMFLMMIFLANLSPPMWLTFLLHITAFLFTTLMCHGELAKDRPTAAHLTEFYLWMSFGGMLGGLFNALVAPTVFQVGVLEYPLALIVSCFVRPNMVTEATLIPGDSDQRRSTTLGWILDAIMPAGVLLLAIAVLGAAAQIGYRAVFMMAPAVAVMALAMRPWRFGMSLFLVWGLVWLHSRQDAANITSVFEGRPYEGPEVQTVFEGRSFFGPLKVRKNFDEGTSEWYHTLLHGTIDHGRQHLEKDKRRLPTSYFHPLTGIGQVFSKLGLHDPKVPTSIFWGDARMPASLAGLATTPFGMLPNLYSEPPYAVVGLGTGTLATYSRPLQHVDFYEIDPLVMHLSLPPDGSKPYFTFLKDALDRNARLSVILGDGRLKMKEAPEHWYHLISLDAFSSDAIPIHLLTKEALELYLSKLAPGGVLVFNATNRYVDIKPVLRDLADELDLETLASAEYRSPEVPEKYGTDFVVLRRRNPEKLGISFSGGPALGERLLLDLERPEERRRWTEPPRLGGPLWTDRYSNLLRVMTW